MTSILPLITPKKDNYKKIQYLDELIFPNIGDTINSLKKFIERLTINIDGELILYTCKVRHKELIICFNECIIYKNYICKCIIIEQIPTIIQNYNIIFIDYFNNIIDYNNTKEIITTFNDIKTIIYCFISFCTLGLKTIIKRIQTFNFKLKDIIINKIISILDTRKILISTNVNCCYFQEHNIKSQKYTIIDIVITIYQKYSGLIFYQIYFSISDKYIILNIETSELSKLCFIIQDFFNIKKHKVKYQHIICLIQDF